MWHTSEPNTLVEMTRTSLCMQLHQQMFPAKRFKLVRPNFQRNTIFTALDTVRFALVKFNMLIMMYKLYRLPTSSKSFLQTMAELNDNMWSFISLVLQNIHACSVDHYIPILRHTHTLLQPYRYLETQPKFLNPCWVDSFVDNYSYSTHCIHEHK